ncbi:Copper amine oxidase N-terminal domain-containing protein [Thermanaeromonas toyohensis ToBE]|uniref:Copper amine oxidase N-terminal domain-containing protein n=1 Tax=Thermanaeromonas toyohensis ToBE TaxID=698762 RepID=A0A1W1V8P5_9FIRM|nr:copper amine oxidase N-terminal domain-containing protein [Thermanaeromonas toyohensis]SMB89616.1 Copper amine oxidase N-terminal domain-containing protein [Thermanaeromonas toyohensis ToBE]
MRRIRRKWLSILLTLALLVGLMVPFAGSAVAETTYVNFSGAYSYVTSTGDNKAVTGYVYLTEKLSGAIGATTYVTLTLPDGVEYMAAPSTTTNYVYQGDGITAPNATLLGGTTKEIDLKWDSATGGLKFVFNASNYSALKIASTFSGDLNVSVRVWRVDNNGAVLWDESSNVTIAKVIAGKVSVTAASPTNVYVGTNQTAATITIQENVPGTVSGDVYVTLLTSDVTFGDTTGILSNVGINANVAGTSTSTKLVINTTPSSGIAGKLTITPKLNIPPTVSGDIQVKVSGSNTNIPETTLTIAKVAQGAVTVSALNNSDQIVYQGQSATLTTDLSIKPQTGAVLPQNSYITLQLPEGAKWNFTWSADSTPFVDTNGGTVNGVVYKGVYNSGRSIWFIVNTTVSSEIQLRDLQVIVSPTFPVGDLVVTVGGNAGVSGSVTIAQVKAPFTVTASKPEIKPVGGKQAAGNIVITEAAAGVLKVGKNITLSLPYGVSFNGTPTATVKSGNIGLGSVDLKDNVVTIPVTTASTTASTIEISGIYYDTDNRAALGDVVVTIGGTINEYNSDPVAKIANAVIVSPTKRVAVFTLGSNVYTVNGTQYTMDVAAYTKDGRTYLPVRYVAYALGVDPANVLWDDATQTVTLIKGTNVVQLTIGSKVLKLNGISINMDVAPELVSGRTMLPFRFIAQALGATVSYDEATQTVTMNLE